MQDAQFVFVTEDARVMAMLCDGRLEDVTQAYDLLPRSDEQSAKEQMEEKRRILRQRFAV